MSTLTRALAKAMLKSLNTYECFYDQVDRAANKKTKSHESLRKELKESYVALYSDWKFYNVRSVRLGLVGILIDLRWSVEETELFVQGLNGRHSCVTLRKIFSVCKRNKMKILFLSFRLCTMGAGCPSYVFCFFIPEKFCS